MTDFRCSVFGLGAVFLLLWRPLSVDLRMRAFAWRSSHYVSACMRVLAPPPLAGKKKVFFFVSKESTAAILSRLGNQDFDTALFFLFGNGASEATFDDKFRPVESRRSLFWRKTLDFSGISSATNHQTPPSFPPPLLLLLLSFRVITFDFPLRSVCRLNRERGSRRTTDSIDGTFAEKLSVTLWCIYAFLKAVRVSFFLHDFFLTSEKRFWWGCTFNIAAATRRRSAAPRIHLEYRHFPKYLSISKPPIS